MASRIKGITVEIGGDTTDLDAAVAAKKKARPSVLQKLRRINPLEKIMGKDKDRHKHKELEL